MLKLKFRDNKRKLKRHKKLEALPLQEEHTEVLIEVKELKKKRTKSKRDTLMNILEL